MPEKVHRCADHLQADGKSESSSWAICNAKIKELEETIREGGAGSGRRSLGQLLKPPEEHKQKVKDKIKKHGSELLHAAATHGGDISHLAANVFGMAELQEIINKLPDAPMARERGGHFAKPRGSIHEGGVGSGRKAKGLRTPDKAHIGWKNYGIDAYIDKAEKDYKAKQPQVQEIAERYSGRSLDEIIKG